VKLCVEKGLNWPNNWILHHDNPPAYQMLSSTFWHKKLITEVEHATYSPHLALSDFWLFPKIKSALNGQRFQDIKDIQKRMRQWH
jgi:hypothetical protein